MKINIAILIILFHFKSIAILLLLYIIQQEWF